MFFEKSRENNHDSLNDINLSSESNNTQTPNGEKQNNNSNLKFELKINNTKKVNHQNIPILEETKKLRMNVLKQLNDRGFSEYDKSKNNIAKEDMDLINKFQREKPFKVVMCDKNVGFMLISNENHRKLSLDHLDQNETYRKCNETDFDRIVSEINEKIDYLTVNKHLNKKLANKLKINTTDTKPGRFKILSKIHKEKFGIRPIISCSNHPTAKICAVIDQLIKPIVNSIATILKDSQQLIQIANDKIFKKKPYIYSGDFESLYTNIKPGHATSIIPDFLEREYDFFNKQSYLDKFALVCFLTIIFECNIFVFEMYWYLQLIGLPMGCICGPTIANLFLYILERQYINIHNDQLYLRFIDDTFLATDTELDQDELKTCFGYLKLNIVTGDSVNFLDLTIGFNITTMKLHFSLYIKPTNSFSYLKTFSNHPSHIFKNIPISLFLRIRRICSSFSDYLHFARVLYFQLIKRGYNKNFLNGVISSIAKTDRISLIAYKAKSEKIKQNTLKVFLNFECHFEFIKNVFRKELYAMKYNYSFLNNCKFLFINRMRLNLSALFVHNLKMQKPKKYCFKKCNFEKCYVCNLSFNEKSSFLDFDNFIKFPILSHSCCSSMGCIYIIKCTLCNHFYIGETSRKTSTRIKEHLYSITKMKKDLLTSLKCINFHSEVAQHFNHKGHNISEHFRFTIFVSDVNDDMKRKSIETDVINVLILKKIKLMNMKIPNFDCINHLTFSNFN
jgi:hypothetical protein